MAAAAALMEPLGMGEQHNQLAQVMAKVVNTFKELTASVQNFNSVMLNSIAAYKPFQVELFTRRLKDLQAVFGLILLPVLLETARYIRVFADYLLSLSKPFRDVVQGVGKITVVLGIFAFLAIPVVAAITAVIAVFSVLMAAATAVAIVGWPVTLIVIAVTAILAALAVVAAALTAVIVAVVYAFSQTIGGAAFFHKAIKTIGDAFETVWQVIQGIWAGLKPFRDEIAKAFSEFGDALSNLLDEFKPEIFAAIIAVLYPLAAILAVVAAAIGGIVKVFTFLANGLRLFFNMFNRNVGIGNNNLATPKQQSAFGLAAQGGHIEGDVAGMKTRIEEKILAQTGREEGAPETDLPTIANTIASKVVDIYNILYTLSQFMQNNAATRTASNLATAAQTVDKKERQAIDWIKDQLFGD